MNVTDELNPCFKCQSDELYAVHLMLKFRVTGPWKTAPERIFLAISEASASEVWDLAMVIVVTFSSDLPLAGVVITVVDVETVSLNRDFLGDFLGDFFVGEHARANSWDIAALF